ncbi:MAG TPA: nucleotide exchange factor GrpE [Candidatus Paceibacterota bacterium]
MEEEIEKITQERDEYLAGWKRAKADLINYKKEESQRMRIMAEYAEQELLLRVFPILDNLERAAKEIPDKGIAQILAQWKEFLKSRGVEEIECVGTPFNPEVHEAVGEVDGKEPGIVAEEVEKGYTRDNQIIRPAKVKVTK